MEYYWWGIIILLIIIIVTIVVIVWLNHGNRLDIINQLPTYRIYWPEGKLYMGLTNVNILDMNPASVPYPIGTTVWLPIVTLSSNPLLNQWQFVPPSTTTFDVTLTATQRIVKLLNVIYNQTSNGYSICPGVNGNCTVPINGMVGYLQQDPNPPVPGNFTPLASFNNADTFIYTVVGENQFTLTTTDGYISIINNALIFLPNTNHNHTASVFQLVPL